MAKKMWYRGDRITGRDILDYALIAERDLEMLMRARHHITRHAAAILDQLDDRHIQLKQQFDAIDALQFHPNFDNASQTLKDSLTAMLALPSEASGP